MRVVVVAGANGWHGSRPFVRKVFAAYRIRGGEWIVRCGPRVREGVRLAIHGLAPELGFYLDLVTDSMHWKERNKLMLDRDPRPELCLAFPGARSWDEATYDLVAQARARGIPTHIHAHPQVARRRAAEAARHV